jgi:exodeoxyribonuclease V alpha subunit
MAYVQGLVSAVVYRAEEFHILAFTVEDAEPPALATKIKITAYLFGLQQVRPGLSLRLVGEWGEHPKYGRQFVSHEWHPWAKKETDVEFCLHECIAGFADWDIVRLVVAQFGLDSFEVLTKEPERVLALAPPGTLLADALKKAVTGWHNSQMMGRLAPLLSDNTVPPNAIRSVMAKYGTDAAQVVQENPYRLVSISGFTFAHADRLAEQLGIPKTDPRRAEGAVLETLQAGLQGGHLYVRLDNLGRLFRFLTDAAVLETFKTTDLHAKMLEAVGRLEAQNEVAVDPNAGVYLPDPHRFEKDSARKIAQFMAPSKLDIDLGGFLLDYERSQQIELSEAQKEAVRKLVESRVLVLTGLPGTGKTTVIRAFTYLFRQARLSFLLMAPTGIAAKRLSSVTSTDAATIHRALRYDGESWHYGLGQKYTVDAVIVDEMSMVDQELFYRILDAFHPGTMLVLVGDDAQLPSVGAGNVLHELVACPEVPHIRLTQIFRQAVTSEIVYASHKINRGESPLAAGQKDESEFRFVFVPSEDDLAALIVNMADRLKQRDANFQVLSPKYDGIVGVNALNAKLRERLNPDVGQKECVLGDLRVREGDRLMVIQNDYDLSIYNGDMAKLVAIEKDSLHVRIHGLSAESIETMVHIPKSSAPELLKLAYAITVHKSQGSEFDIILIPVVRSQGRMLQRNLLYTGVTRARKKVWLLGDPQAVQQAIENDKVVRRNSVFGRRISEEIQALAGVLSGAS